MAMTVAGPALTRLRGATFGALVMLIIQVAVGIAVNLYVTVPAADKGSSVLTGIGRALSNGPAALAIHAGLGLLLILASVGLLIRAIIVRYWSVVVLSALGLLAVLAAAAYGSRFVSTSQNSASLAMALATAFAMLCYAVTLFLLSGPRRAH